MALGIKETLDVLVAAESTFDGVIAACADRKLGILDLRHALGPVKAQAEAVRGVKLVPAEMKDLDAAEVETLVTKLATCTTKALEAFTALTETLGQAA